MDNLEAPQVISAPEASSSTALKNQIPDEPQVVIWQVFKKDFRPSQCCRKSKVEKHRMAKILTAYLI